MTDGVPLPEDGPVQIGPVSLPAGQRIYGMPVPLVIRQRLGIEDIERAAAWVTSHPMADAGEAWLALYEAHPRTGLVPVLLYGVVHVRKWGLTGDTFGFFGTQDVLLLDSMSAQAVLAQGWDMGENYLDPDLAEERAPFGAEFPGLSPTEQTRLPEAASRAAIKGSATKSSPGTGDLRLVKLS